MTSGASDTCKGDGFDGPDLRDDLWVPHYLPQWTTPDRSTARFRFVPEGLQLRIDEGQPNWRVDSV